MQNLTRRSGKFPTILSLFALTFTFFSFLSTHEPPASAKGAASATALVSASAPAPNHNAAFSFADSQRLNLLYDNLQLQGLGLSSKAYHEAITGFLNLVAAGAIENPGVLTIIDFSQPSSKKRLFIVDMFNGKLLYNTLVAHGRNSGELLATRFSNRRNSLMSSLGFYLTGQPFIGQHGYSLRLEGMEKGWNDNIYSRAIIMHPAEYVSEEHVQRWGFLGRSEGCPAIPEELKRPIIDLIQGGSCIFVYSPDKRYHQRSRLAS